jgi:hypothetical protein
MHAIGSGWRSHLQRVKVAGIALVAVTLSGCAAAAPAPSSVTSNAPVPTSASTTAATAPPAPGTGGSATNPALVGEWKLDRSCDRIVAALMTVGHPELIKTDVGELIKGNVDGEVPADWDPAHPCANAPPPTPHSHTFWRDGTFNSYDETGQQVDDGTWELVDPTTLSINASKFKFAIIDNNSLSFEPADPATAGWWEYAVSYPGSTWTRVMSGPHVP